MGPLERYVVNSLIPANEHTKDDRPTTQPCFREIGFPAVAAALCCARMPPPEDERADKHPQEPLWTDLWAEQPWFGVP